MAGQGAYSVAGLYDPEVLRFSNGLRLILKQRTGLPTVSVRVRVGLGMGHYECGQRHVPHFLEHMLFDAIPGMPQQELERRFFKLGATSNAVTGPTQTVYKLDVFNHTAGEALDLTADMLTRAELEPHSFLRTQKVIYREEGGDPGSVESESLAGGRLASGAHNALADVARWYFGLCGTWDNGKDVAFEQVQQAYRDYYTPDRMTWVIVGDFDRDAVVDWARRRLADLPAGEAAGPIDPAPDRFHQSEYTGYSDEPLVALLALTDGYLSDDYYAHALLEHLLDSWLYERLRLDTALTYTPNASVYSQAGWGIFAIEAETATDDQQEALDQIEALVDRLTEAPLPEEEFRTAQLSLLRHWAQSVETSAGFADYYISSLPVYDYHGRFVSDEVQLAMLTPQSLHRAARRLFAPDNVVYVRDGDRQAVVNTGLPVAREAGTE